MIETEFRPITDSERSIFLKLLELDFPGRDELKAQLEGLLAKTIDEDGSLMLKVQSDSRAPQKCRVPVEARCPDSDTRSEGDPHVQLLLHVVEGKLFELEIYKEDSSPILELLNPDKFWLFSPLIPS
jgi:hypothetical protein